MPHLRFLTVTSDTNRIPGQVIHRASVHTLNDELEINATLDYVLAVSQERGYAFVGENPFERQRIEQREFAKLEREARERDWETDAAAAFYERSVEA